MILPHLDVNHGYIRGKKHPNGFLSMIFHSMVNPIILRGRTGFGRDENYPDNINNMVDC